jgi:hypothetical protein
MQVTELLTAELCGDNICLHQLGVHDGYTMKLAVHFSFESHNLWTGNSDMLDMKVGCGLSRFPLIPIRVARKKRLS